MMNRRCIPLFTLTVALLAAPAAGQAFRTFVSVSGDDVNPCTRALPCRTFGAAINAVTDRGEVLALDSGGYGPFTITRSVSVLAVPGIYAAIAPTTGAAINITAAGTDVISLRGLSLTGLGATHGVYSDFGGTLFVDDTLFHGFSLHGIFFGPGRLSVQNCGFTGNNSYGIYAVTLVNLSSAAVHRCRFDKNGNAIGGGGVLASRQSRVVVSDSSAAGNARGFEASGTDAVMFLTRVTAANGEIGLLADGPTAIIRVTESTITNNTVKGIERRNQAMIHTRADNTLAGNAATDLFNGSFPME